MGFNQGRLDVQALRWIMRHDGVDVTVGGETHRAFEGDVSTTKDVDGVGFIAGVDATYYIVKSDWTTLPAAGNTLTTNSADRKVLTVVTGQNDPIARLDCGGVVD